MCVKRHNPYSLKEINHGVSVFLFLLTRQNEFTKKKTDYWVNLTQCENSLTTILTSWDEFLPEKLKVLW